MKETSNINKKAQKVLHLTQYLISRCLNIIKILIFSKIGLTLAYFYCIIALPESVLLIVSTVISITPFLEQPNEHNHILLLTICSLLTEQACIF